MLRNINACRLIISLLLFFFFSIRRPGTETTTTRRPRALVERQDRPAGGTRRTAEITAANRVRCWVFIDTYIISFPHFHRVQKKDFFEFKLTSEIQHGRPQSLTHYVAVVSLPFMHHDASGCISQSQPQAACMVHGVLLLV